MFSTHLHLSPDTRFFLHQAERCQWLEIADPHGNTAALFASDTHLLTLARTIVDFLLKKETLPYANASPAPAVSSWPPVVGSAAFPDDGRPGRHA